VSSLPLQQPLLRDGDLVLRPPRGDDPDGLRPGVGESPSLSCVVERAGTVAGVVELHLAGRATGRLTWSVVADHRGRGTGLRAVRLLVAHTFADLGLQRVEAYVDSTDVRSLRLAARAGLRREGVVRGHEDGRGESRDRVLLARLAGDPAPTTRDGFRGVLNAALPTKRVIAQGLLGDGHGRVLLCELTYKPDWDLPGGVVERQESPRECVVREVAEELGIRVTAGDLLTVDWLPPWAGWDDACLLTFDLGTVDAAVVEQMVLEPREIAAVHWADPATVGARCRPQVADRLGLLAGPGPVPAFLESGRAPKS